MDADRMSSRLATPQSVARSVAGSVVSSSRASSSIYSCLPFSARDPRAFPLAGASKEHERLHRQIHDDAAGKRISWWLRQRDKSNEYVKSRGYVVGGPSVVEEIHEKDHVATQLTKAFQGAAGRRTSKIKEPEPFVPKDPAFEHSKQGLVLDDLAGKETVRQSTMREVLKDTSGAINAAEVSAKATSRGAERSNKRGVDREQKRRPAGRKILGHTPRTEGVKVHPSGKVALIDQLICGHDISQSPQKLEQHLGRGEFKGAAGKKCLGEVRKPEGLRTNVAHATFSQVDEVVFGHDMDFSISRTAEHLEDANFEGAAGRRYVGSVEKPTGLKQSPAKTVTHVDTVILGRDIGHSQDRVVEHLHRREFQDAAGAHCLGQKPRKEGLQANFIPGASQVEEIMFGDTKPVELDHLRPEKFEGAAGRKCIGQGKEHSTGVKPSSMAHVTVVDKIAFGRPEGHDGSERMEEHLRSPEWSGAAGRKCVGAPSKPEGRQIVLGAGLSDVDEIVWGHDIDRSNEKVRLKELERLKAIGAIGSLTAR